MASNAYTVTLNFKNGTDDADFVAYDMFGDSTPGTAQLDTFIDNLSVGSSRCQTSSLSDLISYQPSAITSLGQWCGECGNNISRGCGTISALNTSQAILDNYLDNYAGAGSTLGRQHVSPIGAGFIGAAVTIVLASVALAALWALGMLAVGRKATRQSVSNALLETHQLTSDSGKEPS